MEDLINRAKQYLEHRRYVDKGRKWLGPISVTPYNYSLEQEGMEFWVLEGSPCRGFIVANYPLKEVTIHDINHCMIKRLRI